jgi:hypothetical protein
MAKKLISDRERFAGKYLADTTTGCWCWLGALDSDGYAAQMKIGSRTDGSRRQVKPHRWIYEQERGKIGEGLVIDHLCRNRRCVNPEHMEAVTPLVNHQRGLRARRTVCPKGHAIAGTNLLPRKGGARCRICSYEYQRNYSRATGYRYSKAYKQRRKESDHRLG